MPRENRKFLRFECLLPVELIKPKGKHMWVGRATARDFSVEGLKLSIHFQNIEPGSDLNLKLYCPERKMYATLTGEVTWNKWVGDKQEVGLKIKDMDKKSKSELLNWLFPRWLEKEKEVQEKE